MPLADKLCQVLLGVFRHYQDPAALTAEGYIYWSGCNSGASPEIGFSHWYVTVGRLKDGNMLPSADPTVGTGISNCYSRIQSSHSSVHFVPA